MGDWIWMEDLFQIMKHIQYTVVYNKLSTKISFKYLPFLAQPNQLKMADFWVSNLIYGTYLVSTQFVREREE